MMEETPQLASTPPCHVGKIALAQDAVGSL